MNEPVPEKVLNSLELKIICENNINETLKKEIIIGVCVHNNTKTIKKCLLSIIKQDIFNSCALLILDDSSEDNWMENINEESHLDNVLILKANCGTPARSRNTILDFVDNNFINPKWVARLDADDTFTQKDSLSTMCNYANSMNANFVIGGNRLTKNEKFIPRVNHASKKLLDKDYLIQKLKEMALNKAYNELPSCNLILKAKQGFRYPDIRSAEDHWLLSNLLFFHSDKAAILEDFFYCDYSLSGKATFANKKDNYHLKNREKLYQTFLLYKSLNLERKKILGYGMEGIVIKEDNLVYKHFYPNMINTEKIDFIDNTIGENDKFIPKGKWRKSSLSWIYTYKYFKSNECQNIKIEQAKEFLLFCLHKNIVCINIKRSNFRVHDNKLVYIDIGNSIIPMDIRYFIDSAARLFCISSLNYSDYELQRRKNLNKVKQDYILNQIPGFMEFYNNLLLSYFTLNYKSFFINKKPFEETYTTQCSLMIKACAMDYDILVQQIKHIVFNLEKPRKFFEKVLLIDSREDNFLRQYQKPDLEKVCLLAKKLKKENIIDRIILSPKDKDEIKKINNKWFGLECSETHTNKNAPVFPQIWGFEQIKTRYLLQCDIDILIGKKSLSHDYLSDMLTAIKQKDVIGVAFNIPFENKKGFRKYDAPLGEYVPEVRCGLLDLKSVKTLFPLSNKVKNGKLELSWFRSLHKNQIKNNKRTLRGGDPQTFYIHPHNHWKKNTKSFFEIQDLINQVKIPDFQFQKWDLEGSPELWSYPNRDEEIVFLIKGQNIPVNKINRCFASLKMQTDQEFGLVVVDDASNNLGIEIPYLLNELNSKTTLIRNYKNKGRIPNFIRAISEVCTNKETLIVILDLDDALIDKNIVLKLKKLLSQGHDLIQGGMFRPNKPLKLYIPNYKDSRKKFGGNVWTHLRAFKKHLFDKIDKKKYLKFNNEWIDECTDYATMLPLVELSKNPIFIYEYWYLHENTTNRTIKGRLKKDTLIRKIVDITL